MTSKISNFFELIKKPLFNSPWGNNGGNYNGNSGGPWGAKPQPSGGNSGGGNNQNNNGQKPGGDPRENQGKKINRPQNDDFFDKTGNFFDKIFNSKTPKSLFGLFITVIIVIWMGSGIYKINSDENGLVMYFGKFYSISTPGLNYHLPYPFGKVIKQSVTRVYTEEFGAETSEKSFFGKSNKSSVRNSDNLMLTGDENIVDIDFQIQWQVSDIKDFVFNLEDPEMTIHKSAISAIREIIARAPIASALSDGKKKIEDDTKVLLQQILDSYGAGVRIVLVQLRRVDPPAQVIDAFRDVQTAKADKEREINQAQAYRNDIIPRAKGEAAKIIEGAKAYKQEVVAEAEGQASRFNALYSEYSKSPIVTRKKLYLEQMEKTYRDIDKVIIDKNISKAGAIPYLPINKPQSASPEKTAKGE